MRRFESMTHTATGGRGRVSGRLKMPECGSVWLGTPSLRAPRELASGTGSSRNFQIGSSSLVSN